MRILLVDDEVEFVSTLAERLAIRGMDADWAACGEEALDLAKTKPYDLAVLDIKIPRISGVRLKKKLQEKYPDMKFIFMTGHGSEADYNTCVLEAGAGFCLVKPVDIKILMEKIDLALQPEEVNDGC